MQGVEVVLENFRGHGRSHAELHWGRRVCASTRHFLVHMVRTTNRPKTIQPSNRRGVAFVQVPLQDRELALLNSSLERDYLLHTKGMQRLRTPLDNPKHLSCGITKRNDLRCWTRRRHTNCRVSNFQGMFHAESTILESIAAHTTCSHWRKYGPAGSGPSLRRQISERLCLAPWCWSSSS